MLSDNGVTFVVACDEKKAFNNFKNKAYFKNRHKHHMFGTNYDGQN